MPNSSQLSFMKNLIDYAGIYPPANLSLEQAIQNYAAYLSEEDAWMLGRFVLPASRLDELEPYIPLFSAQKRLSCTVLGRRSDNQESCIEGLKADLKQVSAFRKRYGEIVEIDVMELPLPAIPIEHELLLMIKSEVNEMGLELFCEVTNPLDGHWQQSMLQALNTIGSHPECGIKLRMGGIAAAAFPTPEQAALVLHACRERNLRMKFTAGLHHPIRMFRHEIGARMHGFINVFAAGMLSHVYLLDMPDIVEILKDEEPKSFSFTERGLAWRDKMIPVSEITKLRAVSFCSFGSCSFSEPREDLRLLKLL